MAKSSLFLTQLSRIVPGQAFWRDLSSIDSVHQRIHDGVFYSAGFFDAAVLDDADLEMLFRVAAGSAAHVRPRVATGGDGELELFEGPDISADGAALARVNRNRFSSNTATSTAFSGPTIGGGGDGTLLEATTIPGGTGGNSTGSADGAFFDEWILNPGDYLLRITNRAGTTQPFTLAVGWYEPGQV